MPKVSGLMPVYNLEGCVAETLESVLTQDLDDWELIVVDDGSTDGTLGIAREYATRDSRIRVLANEVNVGRARSRSRAAEHARGEYLAVVDGDDVSLPSRFRILSQYLDQHGDIAVVGGQPLHLLGDGTMRSIVGYPISEADIREKFGRGTMGISHASCMMRRSVFWRYGGYHADSLRAQDLELFLRMARHERFANVPDTVLLYRNTPGRVGWNFWNTLHQYHEYARYRSARTIKAEDPAVPGFSQWRARPYRLWRVFTVHQIRYLKQKINGLRQQA